MPTVEAQARLCAEELIGFWHQLATSDVEAIVEKHIADAVAKTQAKLDRCHKAGERIGKMVEVRNTELVEDAVRRVVSERGELRAEVNRLREVIQPMLKANL